MHLCTILKLHLFLFVNVQGNGTTCKEDYSVKNILPSFSTGTCTKRKNFFSGWQILSLLNCRGTWFTGKKKKKNFSHCKMAEIQSTILNPLKSFLKSHHNRLTICCNMPQLYDLKHSVKTSLFHYCFHSPKAVGKLFLV